MANKQKLSPEDCQEKMYGSTLVGTRGQVVIPSQARKDLGIKPGDRLVVMGKMNKALGLIKAEDLSGLLNKLLLNLDDMDFEHAKKIAKKNMEQMLNTLKEGK